MSFSITQTNPSLSILPDDPMLLVFSYLNPSELGGCCQINSHWNGLVSLNHVWKERVKQELGADLDLPNAKQFLRNYHLQQLRSNDAIVAKIEDFAEKISIGDNGRFRCILGSGPGHKVISVEIKGDQTKLCANILHADSVEDAVRKFTITDTGYALHDIGNGDLANPEPIETTWFGIPINNKARPNLLMRAKWAKVLTPYECRWEYTQEPFRMVLRFPPESFLSSHSQLPQKIANILKNKIDILKIQQEKEHNIRLYIIEFVAIVILGCVMQAYSDYINKNEEY